MLLRLYNIGLVWVFVVSCGGGVLFRLVCLRCCGLVDCDVLICGFTVCFDLC